MVGLAAFESHFPTFATMSVRMNVESRAGFASAKGTRFKSTKNSHLVVIKLVPGFDDNSLLALAEHARDFVLSFWSYMALVTGHLDQRIVSIEP